MDQKAQEVLLEIRKSGRVTGLTLELAELVYKYPNSTVNELIEKASEIYPEKDKHQLVGLNKLPSVLKNKNIIKVGNKRHCKIKGTLAYELVPTYKTPLASGEKVLFNKYVDIGQEPIDGGMGTIHFVRSLEDDQIYALKKDKQEHPLLSERFKIEIELLRQYKDLDLVVEILDFNTEEKPYYFVMPNAIGDIYTLNEELIDNLPLQKEIFNKLIDCIESLHKNGTLHRDIKPENFLVFEDNKIVVIDLGIARCDNKSLNITRVTVSGAPGGTESYAPPEYFESESFKYADETWDIFSLAKTFYKLMTGNNPLYMKPSVVPSPIYQVLLEATTIDKSKRYQSAEELRNALNKAYESIIN